MTTRLILNHQKRIILDDEDDGTILIQPKPPSMRPKPEPESEQEDKDKP